MKSMARDCRIGHSLNYSAHLLGTDAPASGNGFSSRHQRNLARSVPCATPAGERRLAAGCEPPPSDHVRSGAKCNSFVAVREAPQICDSDQSSAISARVRSHLGDVFPRLKNRGQHLLSDHRGMIARCSGQSPRRRSQSQLPIEVRIFHRNSRLRCVGNAA